MFVDSHAHLQMPHYKDDLKDVLQRAQMEGVEGIMLVGSNEEDSKNGVALAEGYDFLYASIGIHPHDVKNITDETYKNLRELAKSHKVFAYGEIGLDFFKNYSPRELQVEHFKKQIELADDLALPLIIHIRDAYKECFEILSAMKNKIKKRAIAHCFSSDSENAKKLIDLGFYISFSGAITYKNSVAQAEALRNIPTENLLIETDAPYLSPLSYRGKRNEPAYIKEVAKFIADIKGLSVEDVGRITARNFYEFIGAKSELDEAEVVYQIRNSLYINLTNDCTNNCSFCARRKSFTVKGHNLRLNRDPSADEVIERIGDPLKYDEIVFCGFGEPLIKLRELILVAKYVKNKGGKVRINTNGQGNLIHKSNILEQLKGLVDAISISLNAENEQKYDKICRSIFGAKAYKGVVDFIAQAKKVIPTVTISVVEMPLIDIGACERIASELGVNFRVRRLDEVG